MAKDNTELFREYESIVKLMDTVIKGVPKIPMTSQEILKGLTVSTLATRHPDEVAMTPIMKNILRSFGDLTADERLRTDAPQTKAEKWLYETQKLFLIRQSGSEMTEYDTSLPIDSLSHYWVDCWFNLTDNIRWIRPKQVEEIDEMIKSNYVRPMKFKMLDKSPVSLKAMELVAEDLPLVSNSTEIKEINLPFMTKHTNVGYPSFANDKTIDPKSGKSYATITMSEAEVISKAVENASSDLEALRILMRNNISTEFARYQAKGRLIQATSRLINLVLNQLEAEEIAAYKVKSPLFAGYNNDEVLRNILTEMMEFCKSNDLIAYNIDYHRYDAHVNPSDLALVGAISTIRARGKFAKRLARLRAALMASTKLVAGTLKRVLQVFGRIFSGYIDTNRAGGINNAYQLTKSILAQDLNYVKNIASRTRYRMLVMGDDNLAIVTKNFSLDAMQRFMEREGYAVDDPKKILFGIKFLQFRLFSFEGKYHMAYAFTRVVRSLLMKERPAGLGPWGWTRSAEQQLVKIMDFEPVFKFVVNLIAPFDSNHLGAHVSVDYINAQIKQEDEQSKVKDAKHYKSTALKLNDGDPSKQAQFASGEFDLDFCTKIHNAIVRAYDPGYLPKMGIKMPKKIIFG